VRMRPGYARGVTSFERSFGLSRWTRPQRNLGLLIVLSYSIARVLRKTCCIGLSSMPRVRAGYGNSSHMATTSQHPNAIGGRSVGAEINWAARGQRLSHLPA
jgi:hypothetical protein